MASNLTKFNKTISQFIDNMIETYSDDAYYKKELEIFKMKFEVLRKTNPQKCLENFLVKLYPYKQQIMDENEDFFLRKDYSTDTNNEENLMKALKLKELCEKEMSPEIKKNIFTYFKVLIILSERCVADRVKTEDM